jgi:amidase
MRICLLFSSAIILTACSTEPSEKSDVLPFGPSPTEYANIVEAEFKPHSKAAQTLPELSDALLSHETTSVELTQIYLKRIEKIDRSGPRLQSVLSLNPEAINQAKASDERRQTGNAMGVLDGIPILLKDNIETLDPVATTAGAYALKDNITYRDSPLVAGLREQGAIILGKTNLSQWANFRSNESVSGWSALGGQVRNPHMLDRSPCGSSSGSGVAVAASLAAGAVGTETNGSIICPANVNGIVGFKPTVGLVSQDYIVPISASQDTAGPMTKTVKGAAMMLAAMDNQEIDYVSQLNEGALRGKRVGVLRFAEGSNDDIKRLFNTGLEAMEEAGATLVDIESFSIAVESYGQKSLNVLQYEFKAGLDKYLADAAPAVQSRSLKALIAFNENEPRETTIFDQDQFEASEAKGPLTDKIYLNAKKDVQLGTGADGIDRLMSENSVDMLVSPSGPVASRVDLINGDVWPSWAGAGYLAAVAGYPHITVPMGDVHGVPVGFSIMAGKNEDGAVLSYGYAFEKAGGKRLDPEYLRSAEDRIEIRDAIRP